MCLNFKETEYSDLYVRTTDHKSKASYTDYSSVRGNFSSILPAIGRSIRSVTAWRWGNEHRVDVNHDHATLTIACLSTTSSWYLINQPSTWWITLCCCMDFASFSLICHTPTCRSSDMYAPQLYKYQPTKRLEIQTSYTYTCLRVLFWCSNICAGEHDNAIMYTKEQMCAPIVLEVQLELRYCLCARAKWAHALLHLPLRIDRIDNSKQCHEMWKWEPTVHARFTMAEVQSSNSGLTMFRGVQPQASTSMRTWPA